MKLSRSKKKMPICPNCKEKHKLFVVNEVFENETYKYLLLHNTNLCPYGYENYQKTINAAIEETNKFINEKFSKNI